MSNHLNSIMEVKDDEEIMVENDNNNKIILEYIEKLLKTWDEGEEFSIKEALSKIVDEVNVPRD